MYENCALFPNKTIDRMPRFVKKALEECCLICSFYIQRCRPFSERFELDVREKLIQLAKLILLLSNKSEAEKYFRDQNVKSEATEKQLDRKDTRRNTLNKKISKIDLMLFIRITVLLCA